MDHTKHPNLRSIPGHKADIAKQTSTRAKIAAGLGLAGLLFGIGATQARGQVVTPPSGFEIGITQGANSRQIGKVVLAPNGSRHYSGVVCVHPGERYIYPGATEGIGPSKDKLVLPVLGGNQQGVFDVNRNLYSKHITVATIEAETDMGWLTRNAKTTVEYRTSGGKCGPAKPAQTGKPTPTKKAPVAPPTVDSTRAPGTYRIQVLVEGKDYTLSQVTDTVNTTKHVATKTDSVAIKRTADSTTVAQKAHDDSVTKAKKIADHIEAQRVNSGYFSLGAGYGAERSTITNPGNREFEHNFTNPQASIGFVHTYGKDNQGGLVRFSLNYSGNKGTQEGRGAISQHSDFTGSVFDGQVELIKKIAKKGDLKHGIITYLGVRRNSLNEVVDEPINSFPGGEVVANELRAGAGYARGMLGSLLTVTGGIESRPSAPTDSRNLKVIRGEWNIDDALRVHHDKNDLSLRVYGEQKSGDKLPGARSAYSETNFGADLGFALSKKADAFVAYKHSKVNGAQNISGNSFGAGMRIHSGNYK